VAVLVAVAVDVAVLVAVEVAVAVAVLVGVETVRVKDKLQDPPYASGLLEGALGATEVSLV
jgi:hypothetical protein